MSAAPRQLRLSPDKARLTVVWADREDSLEAEYLRVCSPSADIRGHGGEWQIVGGKRGVRIQNIQPVGRYAVRLVFSDGHDTGLYTWAGLREFADREQEWWPRYLQRMEGYGMSRDPEVNVMPLNALNALKKTREKP